MDGMEWMTGAMEAAQLRLETATANLADAGSDGFRREIVRSTLTSRGVVAVREHDPVGGAPRYTGRSLDLLSVGVGELPLEHGGSVRSATLERTTDGALATISGERLRGLSGPLRFPQGAVIEGEGSIRSNGRVIDRIALAPRTTVRCGFLEASTTDPTREMVAVLEAQRAFESDQKAILAIDAVRAKDASDVVRPAS